MIEFKTFKVDKNDHIVYDYLYNWQIDYDKNLKSYEKGNKILFGEHYKKVSVIGSETHKLIGWKATEHFPLPPFMKWGDEMDLFIKLDHKTNDEKFCFETMKHFDHFVKNPIELARHFECPSIVNNKTNEYYYSLCLFNGNTAMFKIPTTPNDDWEYTFNYTSFLLKYKLIDSQ